MSYPLQDVQAAAYNAQQAAILLRGPVQDTA